LDPLLPAPVEVPVAPVAVDCGAMEKPPLVA